MKNRNSSQPLHKFSWMGFMYKRLINLTDYPSLSSAARAEKLLALYEEWESEPNMARPKRFSGTRKERLERMERVIWTFEHEESI